VSVLDLVRRETARLRWRAAIASALLPLVVLVGLLTSAAAWLSDAGWLTLPRAVPLLSWLLALAAASALGAAVRRRLAARAAPMAVAAAIEREQGLRRGALTGLLEVAGSGVFADFAAESMGDALRATASRPAPQLRRRVQRAALLSTLAAVQIFALAGTSWARRADGWRALLNPVDAWRGALVGPLAIGELPSRVLRGADLAVEIRAPGRTVVTLRWRVTGGGWQEADLAVDADGAAHSVIPAVSADLLVHASDGRAGVDSALVRVVDRPFVGEVRLLATYPAYLGRAPERLPADAPLRLLAGTRLEVSGTASEVLASVTLVADGRRVALRADGARFAGAFTPAQSAVWRWEVRGTAQPIADVPTPLDIEVVADSVPHAEILSPTGEQFVVPQGRIALDLLAQDDQALTGVALRVRRVGSAGPAHDRTVSDRREAMWSGTATLDLAEYALTPGEALEVTLVARDAAPGAREGVSAPLILRVPTADEARTAADAAAEAAVAAADAAAREQAALAERTANEARTRTDRSGTSASAGAQPQGQREGQSPSQSGTPREQLGYEGAERAREIADEQRAMRQQVDQLEEAARELEDRLRRAGALDTALARQLQDAQRLLREAITPEMAASLERLEDATQQLDAPRTRQSLNELAAQQRQLRQTLERSAEMLRRAAMEGQMQTLADRAKELAEQQRAMADSARAGQSSEQQSRQMQQRTQNLAQQAEQLAQRLEQAEAQTGARQMREGAQQAQQAAQQMGQMGQDAAAGERAAQQMQQSAESMAGARRDQVGEWKAELTDALDRSVQEMMQLAREQDQLAEQARQEQSPTALRPQQSALQQGVQAAQERLEEESRRTTLVSPRSQEMLERARQRSAQASREAAEGRRSGTEEAMRDAADALRQAAAQLTRDRERAGNAQSATGMPELLSQMQQLAQQQGGLNAQMQSLLSMMQRQAAAQGMDAASRDQARQLARSQREVARELDEISDADPTGRAQELAREARALAAALDQGAVDPATKTRQEQLLRRMLDAGRSLETEQREEGQRREARAARATGRHTPTGDVDTAPADRFRVPTWEELRGLSAEDRRLVIEYFRRLNAAGRP
jgi:hypothetical protein